MITLMTEALAAKRGPQVVQDHGLWERDKPLVRAVDLA